MMDRKIKKLERSEQAAWEARPTADLPDIPGVEWECPNCGRSDGDPVVVDWSEFQGDAAHGGVVEFQEEACTLCAARVRG